MKGDERRVEKKGKKKLDYSMILLLSSPLLSSPSISIRPKDTLNETYLI